MPKKLEEKLKREAKKKFPNDKERQDAYVYGTLRKTSDTWNTLTTFTQKTTTGVELKTVSTNLGYLIAFSWTVGGTSPSFTFSIGATLKG